MQYTMPDRYTPANTAGLQSYKIPLKAGIVVPDEAFTITRTWVNPQMQSNSLTMTIPVGAFQGKVSRAVFPALFETVEYIKGRPYPPESGGHLYPRHHRFVFRVCGGIRFQTGLLRSAACFQHDRRFFRGPGLCR